MQILHMIQPVLADISKPLYMACAKTAYSKHKVKAAKRGRCQSASDDVAIQELVRKITTCPGYSIFHNSHGHLLQNPDIVKVWKFIAEVSHEFHRKFTDDGVSHN